MTVLHFRSFRFLTIKQGKNSFLLRLTAALPRMTKAEKLPGFIFCTQTISDGADILQMQVMP